MSYHADGERVDVIHVLQAILPGNETLNVDVQLIPDAHDSIIILLIPVYQHKILDIHKVHVRNSYLRSFIYSSLVGKTNAVWVWWRYEQTHRWNQHVQTSRSCHQPLASLRVVLQDAFISL